MKKIYIIALLVLTMCKGGTDAEKKVLSPVEFQQKIQSTPGAVLLDVRSLGEVKDGCIQGQINFDYSSEGFKMLIRGLDRSKTYLVYCAGGVRSAKAADLMDDLDFKNVYTLDGGFKAWKAAGLPVKDPMKKK